MKVTTVITRTPFRNAMNARNARNARTARNARPPARNWQVGEEGGGRGRKLALGARPGRRPDPRPEALELRQGASQSKVSPRVPGIGRMGSHGVAWSPDVPMGPSSPIPGMSPRSPRKS